MGINREQVRNIFKKEPGRVRAWAKMLKDPDTDDRTRQVLTNVLSVAKRMELDTSEYLA